MIKYRVHNDPSNQYQNQTWISLLDEMNKPCGSWVVGYVSEKRKWRIAQDSISDYASVQSIDVAHYVGIIIFWLERQLEWSFLDDSI